MSKVCGEQDCGKPHYARGYCRNHYKAAMRAGDVDRTPGRGRPPIPMSEDGMAWDEKPDRSPAEVKALMLKRAYEFLNNPDSPREAVIASMRIAKDLEVEGGSSELVEEMRKLREATIG